MLSLFCMQRRIINIFLLLLIFSICSIRLCASDTEKGFIGKTLHHGLMSSRDVLLSPAGWDKTDWIVLGSATALTTSAVFLIDTPVNTYLRNNNNQGFKHALKYVEPLGNKYIGLSVVGFALHGAILKKNYSLETALIVGESYILNGILVQAVKHLAGRSRPYDLRGADAMRWEGPLQGSSFYSGHTSSAFSAASVIAWRYRDTKWVPLLSYSLAALAGFERVYNNQHWCSDILFGAVAGTAIGLFLAKNHTNNPYKIYPIVGTDVNGFTMLIKIGN